MKNKLNVTMRIMCALFALIMIMSLCACGSSAKGDNAVNAGSDYLSDSASFGEAVEESAVESNSLKESRKIIETISYSVATKNFDELVQLLENQAVLVGGYIEQSDVSGNVYEDVGTRYASYTFRIPSDKVDEFTDCLSENSTVTNRSVNTEDVTLEYVDIESRIKALKVEKESLEELLASATSTAEIIEIRDMLTDVIYEIESYESQLRTFDNLVDYTTISIDIDEVEHPVVVQEQTVWQRIGTNLENNFRGLWEFLVELFVLAVSALPFILFIAVIIAVIVIIIKLATRKNAKKPKVMPVTPVNYNPYMPQENKTQKPDDTQNNT